MNMIWFRRFTEPPPDALQLICFPHAGGAASTYAPLSRQLTGTFDVLSVQYPGRQDRRGEAPADGILDLAGRIADELGDAVHDRPYAFFGHSMGALVAYETTRILQSRSMPAPVRLFLSGRGAPGPMTNPHDQLHDDLAILSAVRTLGGTDASVLDDPELVEMVLPALRADYGALASYRWQPGAALNVPVTVLLGDSDPVVPVASVAGWARHTDEESETLVFSGGHFYLSERLDEVCAAVVGRLTTLTGGNGGISDPGSSGSFSGGSDADTRRPQTTSSSGAPAPAGEPGGRHQRTAGRPVA